MTYERNYHSFAGEVACGRWDIAAYRKYLWGTNFNFYMIVVLLRKYSSTMVVSTNLNVVHKSF